MKDSSADVMPAPVDIFFGNYNRKGTKSAPLALALQITTQLVGDNRADQSAIDENIYENRIIIILVPCPTLDPVKGCLLYTSPSPRD